MPHRLIEPHDFGGVFCLDPDPAVGRKVRNSADARLRRLKRRNPCHVVGARIRTKLELGDPLGPLLVEHCGGFDFDYAPDRVLGDGEAIEIGGELLVAVATPGHTSNHLCFGWRGALFTGDHIMAWSTTVVVPPDGDMGDYMASLDKLRGRDDRAYYPAHGPAVTNPQQLVRGMIGHRMQRERQILKRLDAGDRTIPEIVAAAYPGLDLRLVPAAGASVTAHLLDLERRGLVMRGEGETWTTK